MPLYLGSNKKKINFNNERSGVHTYFAFTITYYDSDGVTVLKTEKLPFGSMPSYTPTKDGMIFDGWTTDLVTVTGHTSYVAKWKEPVTFANASWEKIVSIAESGNASQVFAVGDRKPFTITYADGTTEENAFIIADFNKGTAQDGTAINMVLVTAHALETTRPVYNSWKTYAAYYGSDLDLWLNDTLFTALPQELQAASKSVDLSSYGFGRYRKCALLTLEELNTSKTNFVGGGSALALFSSDARRIRTLGKDGAATTYLTRSEQLGTSTYTFAYIETSGKVYGGAALMNSEHGVVFRICI